MVSGREIGDGGSNGGVCDDGEKSRRVATDVGFKRSVPKSREIGSGRRESLVFVRERESWIDERGVENGAIFSRDTDRGCWRGLREEFEIHGEFWADEFECESRGWSGSVRSVRGQGLRRP